MNLRNYESQILGDEFVILVPKTCSSPSPLGRNSSKPTWLRPIPAGKSWKANFPGFLDDQKKAGEINSSKDIFFFYSFAADEGIAEDIHVVFFVKDRDKVTGADIDPGDRRVGEIIGGVF